MKIALTHLNLPNESKGGVAYQAHYLANTLVARSHAVTLFTFSPQLRDSLYRVYQFRQPRISPSLHSFCFARALATADFSGFDVIHTLGDNYLMWRKHPQLRTFCGSAIDEARSATTFKRRLLQRLIAMLETAGAVVADLNVGISEATRARISQISHVIPCGVDLAKFQPGPKNEKPTVLFVGTTRGRKRGAWLRDIFLKEVRSAIPDAELWCVTDQAMDGDGVVNFGKLPVDKLAELFRSAWLFCLPSVYEGFGIPYIEAMASGTTAVATPNPGAREVLNHGEFGVIAEDRDLGRQLVTLLRQPTVREQYEQRGLERVKMYSWDTVAEQYENLYRCLAPRADHLHAALT